MHTHHEDRASTALLVQMADLMADQNAVWKESLRTEEMKKNANAGQASGAAVAQNYQAYLGRYCQVVMLEYASKVTFAIHLTYTEGASLPEGPDQ
ncbi:hypothetical protein POX_e06291 [Penicillium oxalicum]|uniref:hypothetical protein n=1 Tax=Penicillium oxalicum TaxID=69781 RepID=UPI0020B6C741|nr:hypothetical protein POX_e06291 [Penicillium oxalicum]KAI2788278.1 hypothetical protein POX_e06291 [Penicillium oxalicum]